MTRLTQFSEASNLAVHALAYLASREPNQYQSASEIAAQLEVSPSHLGKVLQRLAKFGLVRSSRGAKGGFALACDPTEVSLLEIVELLDGPFRAPDCLLGEPRCRGGVCVFGDLLTETYRATRQHLRKTTLRDLAVVPGRHRGGRS